MVCWVTIILNKWRNSLNKNRIHIPEINTQYLALDEGQTYIEHRLILIVDVKEEKVFNLYAPECALQANLDILQF